MAAYTMSTAGPILKEVFDETAPQAISKRNTFYSWFRRNVEKGEINTRGYHFSIKTRRNQGYGSLTSSQEGGLLPRAGAPARRKIRVDYRDHFISGELTGRVQDTSTRTALLALSKDAMQDAEESFTTFQDFYLFGNGSGSMGVVTTGYSGGSPTLLTFALAQSTPYGSMMLQDTQRVQFHDPSSFAQRTGGAVTVSTVQSKNTSTDVVTFDAVPTDVVAGDIVVIEDTINREVLGLDYFVGNSGTTWLVDSETGSAITRSAAPWSSANVIDKSSAALSPDFIDTVALQTTNQTGDGEVAWDQVLVSHGVQKNQYRKLGYTLNRTVEVKGNQKLDLGFSDVSHNGMEWRTSSHCQADRIYGLTLSKWKMLEVAKPQMYNFQNGPLIQKPGTDRYYDAAQFAVYARYAVVCMEPYTQFLLKNLAFTAADVRRNLN
jgi:hypothetical protein